MTHEVETRRAELGVDGNCGFALLGENIQEGEAEFVEVVQLKDGYGDYELLSVSERRAAKQALVNLRKRLGRDVNYYFGPSHPYGG